MRKFALLLLLVISLLPLLGCSETDTAPVSSAEQERQLEQQLENARKAEGAAQNAP